MKTLFCIAAVFIAAMYYIGIQKDVEGIEKFMDNNVKLLNILSGREEYGTFHYYPVTVIETTIEEVSEYTPRREVLKIDNPKDYMVI